MWLDYGDGERRRVGPIADSEGELLELLRELARGSGHSERTISTANPTLALSLQDGSRLQAITGLGPMTYAVIRRHRVSTPASTIWFGWAPSTRSCASSSVRACAPRRTS